jgi:hypothetical protein
LRRRRVLHIVVQCPQERGLPLKRHKRSLDSELCSIPPPFESIFPRACLELSGL